VRKSLYNKPLCLNWYDEFLMRYKSTRGGVTNVTFKDAVIMGLASDGGLLLPEHVPDVSSKLTQWRNLRYQDLAFEVMSHFVDDIDSETLRDIIERSYANFDHEEITPVREVGQVFVLELFHGPTLAFKDVALQFLGNVFEHILTERNSTVNILGATSGDTGSAAIEGIRGKAHINIYIMFPEGKTSPIQEQQMTSVLDDNVHNIAIEGSFDDCQSLMKSVFTDLPFKESHNLAAVNSVNWTRVLAQVVYYFSAYFQLGSPFQFDVSVPTGNFGNILAGFIAKKMGLPIRRLILATNSNDILSRFFNTGIYERGRVSYTHSPSMDIQVSSNFERYLYYKCDEDPVKLSEFMDRFAETGRAEMRFNADRFDESFLAASVSDDDTEAVIRHYFETHDYLVDPHTAVGLAVADRFRDESVPLLCLSTAHPAKFEGVMLKTLPGADVSHPTLEALRDLPTRKKVMKADVALIKSLIAEKPEVGTASDTL
jgi:threonine synthase